MKHNWFVDKVISQKEPISIPKALKLRNKEVYKLDWNEATIPPSKRVINRIIKFLKAKNNLNWYADPEANELRQVLSKYLKVRTNKILITNGSNQALELICGAYIENGDEVIIPIPTFSTFKIWPVSKGAKLVEIDYNIKSELDFNLVRKNINSKTKMIYLINPYIITHKQENIKKLAKENPNMIILIDEAYKDYYGKSSLNLINKYKNIIVTRSFSKAFMLAGGRLGYIIANENAINFISKLRYLNSVNAIAHLAGIESIKDLKYINQYVKEVNHSMNLFYKALVKLNFEVIPTEAGFLLFRHKTINPRTIQDKLEKKNIFVKYPLDDIPGYLRMNIPDINQTKKLIKHFINSFKT